MTSPRRGPGRPAGVRPGDSRRLLLEAASAVFTEKGYAAATTREISERAGMQPANLRHHLGTKAQAFHAVYDDCMGRVASLLDQLFSVDPDAAPGHYLRSLRSLVADDPEAVGFLVAAPLERSRSPELRTELGAEPLALEQLVRSTLRGWAERGHIATEPDPDALADVLIASIYGTLLYGMTIDPTRDVDTLVDTLAELVDRAVLR